MEYLACWFLAILVALYVWYCLKRSNMDVPPSVERPVSERDALKVVLENKLPFQTNL